MSETTGRPSFVCATHGNCFDGLASAALVERVAAVTHPGAPFVVRACGYGARQKRPTPEALAGVGSAIVDYQYLPWDELTFYWDHHRTAFADAEARAHFERRAKAAPDRFTFDPSASSCTKLVAETARAGLGLDLDDLADLVGWADRIDAAAFGSAAEATDPDEPVLRAATVTEQYGDDAFLALACELLSRGGLGALTESELVSRRYAALAPRQADFTARVARHGGLIGRVAFADLTERPVDVLAKFVQYRLWPDCAYSVLVTRLASGARIAAGHNPWSGHPLDVDISALCARHGGGGHPMVGGIGLPGGEVERARQIARELVDELNGGERGG